jgi:carboxylesterase
MLPALVMALLVGAGAAWRTLSGRRVERTYRALHPAGDSGLVLGAEPFTLEGTTGHGLLLLHGSGDTPQSLRYLGERLNAAGYTVHAPLLPGHGRSPREFTRVRADEYQLAARQALELLRTRATWVGVVGLSMGGALAVPLAADSPDVRVLVLLAPYLTPPPGVQWVTRLAPAWGLLQPQLAGRGERSVHDPAARDAGLAYGTFSPRALRALIETAAAARVALPRVTAPTLVINSRDDNRIPAGLAEGATRSMHAPVERHWVEGCGHVITVDYCRDTVADLVLGFLARHAN